MEAIIVRYKTILILLGVNRFQEDLKNAILLGQAVDAHLSVMVIAMAAPPPIGAYAETISAAWLEERQGDIAKLADQTAQVKEQLALSGLSFDVQEVYTEFAGADEDIGQRALYADLALVGRQAARDDDLRRQTVGGALFQAAAPLLFNPTDHAANLSPTSVLIAWNSRIEAARAVQQALPVLQLAKEVHVTLVDPVAKASSNGKEPGTDIAAHLARHGVSVTVDVLESRGKAVDQVLKQHAGEIGAQLIVMGAYSHSRLRERVFGGVTRSMLETANVPIFLSH
ncbi:universal stress protein [Rhizobium laguerreae]|uniref:universal stress protein n=1 Tax=Rhizobium laguerreae TaxID=1076926 RepID=UPI001C904FA8|nr:universal stress protein [Rhizobium laguerreae]MBY3095202.1 universal stress protein [Rhizobium laguerreae]